ncbi:uncharacterized protein LOC134535438 [Bacillus rossius redtenbacheri]|uniref:uncharacterized protein LOC134535438 n=1 Tax=Bacillus rossius redtenbacheri TaxID=93214 RepID=UPI002FDDF369
MTWLKIYNLVLQFRLMMAVPLFYYTSSDSFECIYQLGLIWTSSGAAGEGVYLTEMPPSSGRMTIAEHLYKDLEDKYAMAEVCLETDSATVPAEKLIAHPEGHIWMSKTQLGLSSFSALYRFTSDALWTMTEVKSFIKKQHLTLNPYNKSPISQLQEMVVRSGIQPYYKEIFNGTKFVAEVSIASVSAVGMGNTKQIAKSEAAKQLLRKLILRTFENATETKDVYLNKENNILVDYKTDEKETSLCNAVDSMSISGKKPEISRSTDQVLASSEELLKRGSTSGLSLKSSSNSSSPASVLQNPVGKLQEFCAGKRLPLPVYELLPLSENSGLNNITTVVKVGIVVSEGIGWTSKLAKKAAAVDMLHKLSMLSRDEVLGNEISCPNAPLLTDSTIEVQGQCSGSQVPSNPVGRLQEYCVSKGWPLPVYSDVNEDGPSHAKSFVVGCSLINFYESGTGSSKKDAKHNAALKMWRTVTQN